LNPLQVAKPRENEQRLLDDEVHANDNAHESLINNNMLLMQRFPKYKS